MVGAYLGGYALFVGVVAPRAVLTVRARARLAGAPPVGGAPDGAPHPRGAPALTALAGAAAYPVHASELALAGVQFTLLALAVYWAASGRTAHRHPPLAAAPTPAVGGPTFGVPATVTHNLLALWTAHRDGLYLRPAAHALAGAAHRTLQLLHRGSPAGALPRLVGAVRASRGVVRR